jgi:hypothetical protein
VVEEVVEIVGFLPLLPVLVGLAAAAMVVEALLEAMEQQIQVAGAAEAQGTQPMWEAQAALEL